MITAIPASFFGISLGTLGASIAWRKAGELGLFSPMIGEAIGAVSFSLWSVLLAGYILKWFFFREQAKAELSNLISSCYLALLPMTTMLAGVVLLPYLELLGTTMVVAGAVGLLLFSVCRASTMWRGLQTIEATTPLIYLPTVAGNFVTAIALGAAGFSEAGQLFWGAGLLCWISLEGPLHHRLRTGEPLKPAQRPALGIMLAPSFVGCVAYLSVTNGEVDLLARALLGYGLLQFFFLFRLSSWVMQAGFSMGIWAFSFALAAMINLGVRLTTPEFSGLFHAVGWSLFTVGNLLLMMLIAATFRFLFCYRKIS